MDAIDNPIFVRGMSRSGGTLMVTLLDAHPDVAMSYELYPHLLDVGEPVDIKRLADIVRKGKRRTYLRDIGHQSLVTFINRCPRGGLDHTDVADLLERLAGEGLDFSTPAGRLRFIEQCGLAKMTRLGKRRWGMKCTNDYLTYVQRWAGARFVNMLRDGRDVLASQLNTGNFKKTPAEVARAWISTHKKFFELASEGAIRAIAVRYEALATDPKPELEAVCACLGLEFTEDLLSHTSQDLTVFKASHLSADRINKCIDASRIGRWRRDLTDAQLAEFRSVAQGGLSAYGYE